MSRSAMSSTPPAPQTRHRRPAGEAVLVVDTHRNAHVAAVLSGTGTVLAIDEFPATCRRRVNRGSVKISVKPIVPLCAGDAPSLSARCLPSVRSC